MKRVRPHENVNPLREFIFIGQLFLVGVLIFMLNGCSSIESKKQTAPPSTITNTKAIDSIVTNKWLPFFPEKTDTLKATVVGKWMELEKFDGTSHPFTIDSVVGPMADIDIDTMLHVTGKEILCTLKTIPATIPKPLKTGSLRSVSNTNQDILYLDVEQGLPQNKVSYLTEDKLGRLWGCLTNSIICYDGDRIFHFTEKSGLPEGSFYKILTDKKGQIWILGNQQLIQYNGTHFLIYSFPQSNQEGQLADFIIAKDQTIWVSRMPGGVYKIKGKNIRYFQTQHGLSSDQPYGLGEDQQGKIWVGSYNALPSQIHGDTVFKFSAFHHPAISNIHNVYYCDNQNRMWLGGYGSGLHCIDTKRKKVSSYRLECGQNHSGIYDIKQDENGDIWASTDQAGLLKIKQGKFSWYSVYDGLSDNQITSVLPSKHGVIWISTVGGGMCRINQNSFKQINKNEGMSSSTVISFCEDSYGNILEGTWANGGTILKPNKSAAHFDDNFGLYGRILLDILEDNNRSIWIAQHGYGLRRIHRVHPDSARFDLVDQPLPQILPISLGFNMIKDQKGTIWICDLQYGLFAVENNNVFKYGLKSNLAGLNLSDVTSANDGSYWLANYYHGISQVINNQIKHLTTKEGLLYNETHGIFADSYNNVWISYQKNGLSVYNGKKFIHFDENDGFVDSKARGFVEDKNKHIWITTSNGLYEFFKSSSESKGYKLRHYTVADGLKVNDLNTHPIIDQNNVLWMGTSKGASTVHLDDLKQKNIQLNPHIVSVEINGKHISYGNDKPTKNALLTFKGVLPYTNTPVDLSLHYSQNNLAFDYITLNWKQKNKIQYRHRLIGLSNEWSTENNESRANYDNLDPGTYTFEINTRLDGENWSGTAQFHFIILPPWWQTWWFRSLVVVLTLLLIYLVFRWRTAALHKRQIELEQTVEERTAEIHQQKRIIEEKQKETVDSINYAKKIQYALLAHEELLKKDLKDYFIFFKPKDIVSGDFYWATQQNNNFYLAVCDSTGHGVPGAFMSLLNISYLNEAITEKRIVEPGQIFDHARQQLIVNISKDGQKDGMDGILVRWDKSAKTLYYAAANNAPLLVSDGTAKILSADKMPVGFSDKKSGFNTYPISFLPGDILYLITDGFADQFGGEGKKAGGKKFKRKNLYDLLQSHAHLPLQEQKNQIESAFNSWKGEFEQMDDVCVIGIKL